MNRKLLKRIREYKKQALIAPLFVIIEVLFEVLIPFNMSKIIDSGILKGDIGYIIKEGIILLIFALIALFSGIMAGRFSSIAATGYAKNIRKDTFNKLQDYSFRNIDKFSTASLVTRLTTDVNMIQNSFNMTLRLLTRMPVMVIFTCIMTVNINPGIAKVFLILMPFMAVIFILIPKFAHPRYLKVMKITDELNRNIKENVDAQRVVKSFVREDYEISKFKLVNKMIYNIQTRADRLVQLFSPLLDFSIYFVMVVILIIGSRSIVFKTMSAGELTSIVIYAIQIMVSMMIFGVIFIFNIIARPSIARINEILDEEIDMRNVDNPVSVMKNANLEFNHVFFSYNENSHVLEDINFEVNEGETIGIVGATGSAKSSLVHLIPRLYDVTKGSIKIGGIDIKEYDIASLREQISVVLQNNTLFAGSIADNIKWGNPNATLEEVREVAKIAQADEFIMGFKSGYDTMITQSGNNLSGGQKQRVCIARALLKKPRILILDDSTSAVDTKTDASIQKAFKEELSGTTKIIISQRVSSILNADKIIVLDNGKISDIGSPDELLIKSDIYREMYESQTREGVK